VPGVAVFDGWCSATRRTPSRVCKTTVQGWDTLALCTEQAARL
jgi:hypothetical protein